MVKLLLFAALISFPLGSADNARVDCSGRPNGIYSAEACGPEFFVCQDGEYRIGQCKEGYYFNERSMLCETATERFCPHLIPMDAEMECSDGSVSSSQFAPAAACTEDGNFPVTRCSKIFRVCQNGVQSFSECPDGYFFHTGFRACADHCEVAPEASRINAPVNEESENSLEVDGFMAGANICEEDGIFPIMKCSRVFRICKSGAQSFFECPEGYFYNAEFGACADHCEIDDVQMPISKIPIVSQNVRLPDETAMHQPVVSPRIKDDSAVNLESEESLEVDGFMAGDNICEEDGNFAIMKCSRVFRVCQNGVQSFAECPEGYFFHSEFGACADHCETIVAEGPAINQEIAQQPVKEVPSTNQQSTDVHENVVVQSMNEMPSVNEEYQKSLEMDSLRVPMCEQDGVFPVSECSKMFKVCRDGIETVSECPDGYFFHTGFGACADHCGATPQRPADTQETTIAEEITLPQLAVPQPTSEPLPMIQESDSSLESDRNTPDPECQQDGSFEVTKCSRIFRVCRNGMQSFSECPDGYFFNPRFGGCVNNCETDVPQRPVETQTMIVEEILPQFAVPQSTNRPLPLVQEHEDSLEADGFTAAESPCQEDGTFAITECSRVFRVCQNGVQSFAECPDGYFFHTGFHACADRCETDIPQVPIDNQETIITEETVLPQFAVPQPTNRPLPLVQKHEDSLEADGFTAAESSCQQDGNFAITKCSQVFRVCQNGVQSFAECPDGYFFHPEFNACADHCETVVPEGPVINQEIAQQPMVEVPTISQEPENSLEVDIVAATSACERDGSFEIGKCSKVFRVCRNGVESFFECPLGYFFNPEFGGCTDHCGTNIPQMPVDDQETVVSEPIVQDVPFVNPSPEYDNQMDVSRYQSQEPVVTAPPSEYISDQWTAYQMTEKPTTYAPVQPELPVYVETPVEEPLPPQNPFVTVPPYVELPTEPQSPTTDVPYVELPAEPQYPTTDFPHFELPSEPQYPTTDAPRFELPTEPQYPTTAAPHNYDKPVADAFYRLPEATKAPVYKGYKKTLYDGFGRGSRRGPVIVYVNNDVRDGFHGRALNIPILNPFGVPKKVPKLRRDGFDRGDTPERPSFSPFGRTFGRQRRLNDYFQGRHLRVPIINPFARFERRKHYGPYTKVGYAVSNPQKSVDIAEESDKDQDPAVESEAPITNDENEGNKSEEVLWRKRRSANPMCWVKKFSYRPESLGNENSRARSLDVPTSTDAVVEVSESLPTSPECLGREDGHKFASGSCRVSFFECMKGTAVLQSCIRPGEVFSADLNECTPMTEVVECQIDQSSAEVVLDDSEFFCRSRKDGFYQHPSECHRVVQCFGGEVFEHPSCENNLGFDERRGICDYRHNVPGCGVERRAISANDTSSGCNGREHGAHIADDGNCGSYFRCVWDHLELMSCPEGTAFNPELSVCDYPSSVPNCSNM